MELIDELLHAVLGVWGCRRRPADCRGQVEVRRGEVR